MFEFRLQRRLTAFAVLLLAFNFGQSSFAAAPVLEHIYPVALQAGSTNSVQFTGKFDPWPIKIWSDTAGLHFQAETNSGKVLVTVDSSTPPGPHLVRAYNNAGTSEPRFLIVTTEPQILENEPNDLYKKAQHIAALPGHVNGRLDKSGDVDCYALHLEKDQTLIASVEAFVLMSPMDAALRLLNTNGVEVAFNHDDGRSLDPCLTWKATETGTYILQLFAFAHPAGSDIKFTGGNNCVYRLHLLGGPYLRYTLPLGVQRNTNNILELVAWNLPGEPRRLTIGAGEIPEGTTEKSIAVAGIGGAITVPVSIAPETIFHSRSNAAQSMSVPFSVTGCIAQPGEIHRFEFSAQKGDHLRMQLRSAFFGFPLDAWLSVEDSNGKEIARNDDSGSPDPALDWTSTNTSSFVLSVGSVLHRGGPDYLYHLAVERASPDWKATVASSSFAITPGQTNDVKVSIKRLNGFTKPLQLDVGGLPTNILCSGVEVSGKANDAILKFISTEDASPTNLTFHIVAKSGPIEKPVYFSIVATSVDNGVPTGYNKLCIETTDQLWLTVLPKQEDKGKKEPEGNKLK
ncbi:MAG TPA: hypothetical protein VMZ27_05135 [Candidatus Saccharimonadales bacterium]|nr:hypothetical protein [Candidatus Saccharimonadales bacterium]